MHLAYSAFHQTSGSHQSAESSTEGRTEASEPLLRYQAYQAACQKLSQEIIAIQKYMPGWMPAFR